MSNDGNDDDVCIACNIALKNGDKFYSDVDGGYLHAACAGPEREGYVGADGEPLKDGDPIPEPKTWVDPPPSSPVAGGGEEEMERIGRIARNEARRWTLDKQPDGTIELTAGQFTHFPPDAVSAAAIIHQAIGRAVMSTLLSSPRVEERMRFALEKAAAQFEFYEREHREKAERLHGDWDARSTEQENAYNSAAAKALTNETFAGLCRAALSPPQGE